MTLKGRRKPRLRLLLLVPSIGLFVAFLIVAAVFIYFSRDLPSTAELAGEYRPFQATRVLARDGSVLGEIYTERRTVVSLDRIPDFLVKAVIAAEDADFMQHEGLDYPGIFRAIVKNVIHGSFRQGASTITQQVARTFFLTRKRKISRKIRELMLARRLEQELEKDQILFLYLNQIYFGHGRYGIEEASLYYFGKHASEINLSQAALLAGLPKGPAIYSPFVNMKAAGARQSYVLGEMLNAGVITQEQSEEALNDGLELVENRDPNMGLCPEAVDMAAKRLLELVGKPEVDLGGYVITTSIDPLLQKYAVEAVKNGLMDIDRRQGYRGPVRKRKSGSKSKKISTGRISNAEVIEADDESNLITVEAGGVRCIVDLSREGRYNPDGLPASKFAAKGSRIRVSPRFRPDDSGRPLRCSLEMGPQAALVALDSGEKEILAVVGGYNSVRGGYNRAIRAVRQPGSAFKPLTYAAAIELRRYTAASIVDDSPEVFSNWNPGNSEKWDYAGPVSLRKALAHSINMVAIKLIMDVTPQKVAQLARDLGIKSRLDVSPALALGASGVRPLEMAGAYASFASQGGYSPPVLVTGMRGPSGEEIPQPPEPRRQAVTPQTAYVITDMLMDVIRHGTGRRALRLKRPVAGKTGTSNRSRDAWFAGYSPDITTAVWVGFDDYKSLGRREQGSRSALPIWIDFMQKAHENLPVRNFKTPPGIEVVMIDPATGLLPYDGMEGAVEEVFIAGTAPERHALPPEVESPESFMMEQFSERDGGVETRQDDNSGEKQDSGVEKTPAVKD